MGGKRGGRGGRGDREGGDRREDQYGEVGGSQDRQAFSGFNSGKGHTGGGSAGASAKGDFTFIRQVPKFLQRYTHLMGPAAADEDDPVIVGGPEGGRKGGKGGRGGEEGEEEEEGEPEENLEADALRRAMAENPELAKEFEGTLASKLKQAEAAEEKEKGNALFGKKKFEEAAKSFGRCIELDPSNEVYWSNRSASFASLERWEEAAADARRCVALKPGWAKGWARLGAACMGLKLYGDSREAYEKALRIEPDDQQLRRLAEKAESMELQQAQQGKHTFKKMRTGGGGGGGGTGGGRGGAGGGGGGAGAGGGSAPGPGASEAEGKGGAGGSGGAGAAGAAAVPTAAPRPGANKRVLSFADEEEEG